MEPEEGRGTVLTWLKKWGKRIALTVAASGVFVAAMIYSQRDVPMPPIPVAQVSSSEWVLTNDYRTEQDGYEFEFRAGFKTDFASIPGFAEMLMRLDGDAAPLRRGALIHDGCYAGHYPAKRTADKLLLSAIRQDGCEEHKAQAVWQAVMIYGDIAWDAKTPESIREARQLVTVKRSSKARVIP